MKLSHPFIFWQLAHIPSIAASIYQNSVVFDSTTAFTFKWNLSSTELSVSMSAMTTGWLAIGFAPAAASMTSSMAIGWISGGVTTIDSYNAVGKNPFLCN